MKNSINMRFNFSFSKLLGAIGFLIFSWYSDIFALQMPLFAYFICPTLMILASIFWLIKKKSLKFIASNFLFGLPAILIASSTFSIIFSQIHDQWIKDEVKTWGQAIRNEKVTTGEYPKTTKKSLHGYQAIFINDSVDPPVIYFRKFGHIRQSYSVANDLFLEETDS